jgi:hypothetical protein
MCRVCLVAASLFCCLNCLAAASSSVAVFMDFESEPSAEALSQMEREITYIMRPSGIQFDWRMMKDRRPGDSFSDLLVVTFKGACQAEGPTYNELGPILPRQPLAFTHVSEGRILPFSDVECDTIRQYISGAVAAAHPNKREAILGIAIGRVLAHEMYHIFAGTTVHAQDGVARSFHTRDDLIAPEFRFTSRESRVLKKKLKREVKRDPPLPAGITPLSTVRVP